MSNIKTFADFLEAAKIEKAASTEKYESDSRQPLDEKLRLGSVAGPLVCASYSYSKAEFTPLPGVPFDWGKVNPDRTVHVVLPETILAARSGEPKGKLTPETAPTTFTKDTRSASLSLTKGATYIFAPIYIDAAEQVIRILEACPSGNPWPAKGISAPSPSATTAYDRALAVCLNDANPLLAIKGPPGTGKTELLADVAIALAKKGKKVGIVTVSHAAADNALERIQAKAGSSVTIQKHDSKKSPISAKSLPDIWGAVIASATHMYVGRKYEPLTLEFKHGRCDVLLIDEAGQVPAYEAAALSHLAGRMILFGDEDQLPNIGHGQHLPGSHGDSSAMAYMRAVLPGCCFALEESHRMNSTICGLIQRHFYPDIPGLTAGANKDSHLTEGKKPFPALVKDSFPHKHPRLSRSEEEAARVVQWVQRLLTMEVQIDGEPSRPMTAEDIAILTPFRAHAGAISSALAKAKIPVLINGTVDKMQGQGAAVVIYSLATSSQDYIAGQTEWLLSANRWNVALSRAKACAIVVGDIKAHLHAIPTALDGIAAQEKIRQLMEDKKWISSAKSKSIP